MAEDEDDFVFYGTPIEREEDTSARKRKAIADAGQLRSLPTWKQEVRDEEGRQRFHGAFTGGYSAGYYNTVGSKEGWTPQTFTSSRKDRAEMKKQTIYSFLDDEDMKDMGGHALETSSQFDTFGFTAAEVARKQAEKEQQKRPSAIPGSVPDEIVLPAANSIGVKLLVKMGWRHGHSIKETRADSLYDARREARKALLAFSGNDESSEPSQVELSKNNLEEVTERYDVMSSQNTPVYVLYPKQDLHGLGYDPFKHAPEFRDRKRLRDSKCKDHSSKPDVSARSKFLGSTSGKYAPGFGIGALEELDVEDEDIYASGFDYVGTEIEEEEPSTAITENKFKLEYRKQGVLSGFKVASSSEYNLERFYPPVIPPDFEPFHKFPYPVEYVDKFAEAPPLEVSPPDDNSLRLLIEGFATMVARCGKLFEDLSKEKNRSNPLFSFLSGGNGYQYYARKLWEAKQKTGQRVDTSVDRKMTADSRGRILGERPLERSTNASTTASAHKEVIHFQSNLSDSFAKPTTLVDSSERAKPFKDDPAKQERFEQFLKDKYQGGLRSTSSRGMATMSETDRARERLDFEAAAEAIEKGEWTMESNLPSSQQVMDFLDGDSRFVSSTVEKHQNSKGEEKMDKIYPIREEFQWRPSSILCKRFDLTDPFMGKPPPPPRARSKFDALIFMPDSGPSVKSAEANPSNRYAAPTSQSEPQESEKQQSKDDPDAETNSTSVQRPVDLYKAIFSDDSGDEVENVGISNVADPEKKIEGANTTLNRLVAGDFLESLGKELGLEVPLEQPYPVNKANSFSYLTETSSRTDIKTSSKNDKSASTLEISYTHLVDETISNSLNISGGNSASGKEAATADWDLPNHAVTVRRDESVTPIRGEAGGNFSEHADDRFKSEKKEHRSRKHRSHSRHHIHSSASDTDPSSSHGYYDLGRASSKRKSRKHSDHHSRKTSRSPIRYSSRDKEDRDLSDGRKDRRSRDREKHSRKKRH